MTIRHFTGQGRSKLIIGAMSIAPLLTISGHALAAPDVAALQLLGKYVFFDKISNPPRMACVTCHDPATGGTGSVAGVNLHQVAITGANPHTVGGIKPPTNAYASLIEAFGPCNTVTGVCGGNFWDGRATGLFTNLPGATKHIGNEVFQGTNVQLDYGQFLGPTSDQALNPMPNPVEQNIERQLVCEHVKSAKYAPLYEQAWGVAIDCSANPAAVSAPDVDNPPETQMDISFKRIAVAMGAWQASDDVTSFSSKRDKALAEDDDGKFPLDGLTDQENRGHDLFYTVAFPGSGLKGAGCVACHNGVPQGDILTNLGDEERQLYSDKSFHNILAPKNPEIPGGDNALGLGGLTGDQGQIGLFKTPTLRNVDKRKGNGFTKGYTHNGFFKSLEGIVHFYNTATALPTCPDGIDTEREALANNCWPAPASLNVPPPPFLVGNLGLTPEDEADLVAYLKTLTDTHTAKAPPPYKASK